MQAKISSSVILGIIVFVALVPMCFFIGNNKAVYLLTANYSWLAWVAAVLAMALCLFSQLFFVETVNGFVHFFCSSAFIFSV